MKFTPATGVAFVAIAALLWLPTAMAQPRQTAAVQGAASPPPAAAASPLAGHPVPGKNAEERVERRIKELHGQLQITPAEEPQWNEFAQVMRENARDMDQAFMQRAQQHPTMNAVQNMQSRVPKAVRCDARCAEARGRSGVPRQCRKAHGEHGTIASPLSADSKRHPRGTFLARSASRERVR
jgi:hypothetical protein